jgi:hypothetical protein
MFGKLMSISDELMWKYYTLLTDLMPEQVDARRRAVDAGELHPKKAKSDLAMMIVKEFHDPAAAGGAADDFERRSRGAVPTDLAERPMLVGTPIEHLLLECGLARSGSEATRKVQQGAVRVNGEKFRACARQSIGRLIPAAGRTPDPAHRRRDPQRRVRDHDSEPGRRIVDHHAEQGAGRRGPSDPRERARSCARGRGVVAGSSIRVRGRAAPRGWRLMTTKLSASIALSAADR